MPRALPLVAAAALAGFGFGSCIERAAPGLATAEEPRAAADGGRRGPVERGLPDFADLAEAASPAVVNIATAKIVERRGVPQLGFDPEQLPPMLREFFRDFIPNGRGDQGGAPDGAPTMRQQSLGSGFLATADGVVVTNNHVIEGADEIRVVFADGTGLAAEVLGVDPKTDLAVLRILDVGERKFPYLEFGDSDALRVGEWVLAIGNPFGLSHTVTSGIISAKGRAISAPRDIPYQDFLQTDASINPGNSGGPLLDLGGRVVGVNTAIFSRTGQSAGIGFAIPAALARFVVDQLVENKKVVRGFLGVQIQPVSEEIAAGLGLPDTHGALVSEVRPGSPAEKAGMQVGDLITQFNDQPIREFRELPLRVSTTAPGAKATVVVRRDGKSRTLQIVVGELPGGEGAESAPTRRMKPGDQPARISFHGMQLVPADAATLRAADIPAALRIEQIEQGSRAAEAGLRPGDLILQAGGRTAADLDALAEAERVARSQKRTALLLLVRRDGQNTFIALPLGKN